MYKGILALLAVVGTASAACAQQQEQDMNSRQSNNRILVAYFSASGTTARAAEELANVTGATLYAITPAEPYTRGDLDWNDKRSRSSLEMADPNARPAIGGKEFSTTAYEVVFLGYPIWWDLAPRIINTFIESHDLQGKTIVPFATSGSSTIANSAAVLRKTYPGLNWKAGRLMNRLSEDDMNAWIGELDR